MAHRFTLTLLVACAGCAQSGIVSKTHEQLQTELQSIADRCSPKGNLKFDLVGMKELRLRADPSASYGEVECFMQGIKPYSFDLWVIGNEAK